MKELKIPARIWEIEMQLSSIAYLFDGFTMETNDTSLKGIAIIMQKLTGQLSEIRESVETRQQDRL